MSLTLGIALYIVIWWTMLFAVLPLGVRTQGEAGEVVPGTPASAPVQPRFLRIIGINTVVSTIVFAIVWSAVVYKWLPLETLGDIPGTGGLR